MSVCDLEKRADSGGRAVLGVGLQPLDCWDCGFESRSGNGCPSFICYLLCVSVYDLEKRADSVGRAV